MTTESRLAELEGYIESQEKRDRLNFMRPHLIRLDRVHAPGFGTYLDGEDNLEIRWVERHPDGKGPRMVVNITFADKIEAYIYDGHTEKIDYEETIEYDDPDMYGKIIDIHGNAMVSAYFRKIGNYDDPGN